MLFALGNDNTCRVFNVSDTDHPPKLMASIENPNRCRYSAVALEQENDRVYLCDIKGHMVVYSLAEDKVVLQMDVSPTQKRIVGMEWGDEARGWRGSRGATGHPALLGPSPRLLRRVPSFAISISLLETVTAAV